MDIQRTVTIILADDSALRATLIAFREVQQQVSPVCFNRGDPLRAVPLQRACYETVKRTLNSQMTITALRLVAGAYASAKRNYERRLRRTHDFACRAARDLIAFAPVDSILVFEDLNMPRPEKGLTRGKALRRRLSLWHYRAITAAVKNRAERAGIAMATVNAAYTSKRCSRCGLLGVRKRHSFTCPACEHVQHADVNAARNIRNLLVQSRLDGLPSMSPEALPQGEGKLAALAVSH